MNERGRRPLSDVVDSAAGAQLLRALARAPGPLSARELADSTGVSDAQAFAKLKELHEHGLIVRSGEAAYSIASPPWRAALRREDDLLRLWKLPPPIVAQVLSAVRALRDWDPPPLAVVLTGSLAQGEFGAGSDIDLIAILDGEPQVRGTLPGESESDLQRGPAAPLRLTAPVREAFEAELGRKDAFFTNALENGLILFDREYLSGLQATPAKLDSAALPWHELAALYERARGAAERGSVHGHETVQTFMTQLARAVLVAVGQSPGPRPVLRRQLRANAPADVVTAYEEFVEGEPDGRFPPPLHLDLAWWSFESVTRHAHILRPLAAELLVDRLRSIRAGTQRFFQDVLRAQVHSTDGSGLIAERDGEQLAIVFDEEELGGPDGPPSLAVLSFKGEAGSQPRCLRSVDLYWWALHHFASPAEQFGGVRPPFEDESVMEGSARDGERALWNHLRTYRQPLDGPRPQLRSHANFRVAEGPTNSSPATREESSMRAPSKTLVARLRKGVTAEDALARILKIPHANCRRGAPRYWRVCPDGTIPWPSLCWLFCWAATGNGSTAAKEEALAVFDRILVFDPEPSPPPQSHFAYMGQKCARPARDEPGKPPGIWLTRKHRYDPLEC